MLGIELAEPTHALEIVQRALERGVILLPSGDRGRVLSITPPLGIEQFALLEALDVVVELIAEGGS
jgi:4-aminobutyrate aminotransferase-like enzyme